MAKTQANPLAPPAKQDVEAGLGDYTAKIQRSLEDLYQVAHDHPVRSTAPTSSQGATGDIVLVNDGTNRYIAVKYADGWYKTANLTAV